MLTPLDTHSHSNSIIFARACNRKTYCLASKESGFESQPVIHYYFSAFLLSTGKKPRPRGSLMMFKSIYLDSKKTHLRVFFANIFKY